MQELTLEFLAASSGHAVVASLEKYDPDMEDILGALLDENIGSDDTSLSEEDKLRLLLLFSQTEKGSKFNQPSLLLVSSPLTKCSKYTFHENRYAYDFYRNSLNLFSK